MSDVKKSVTLFQVLVGLFLIIIGFINSVLIFINGSYVIATLIITLTLIYIIFFYSSVKQYFVKKKK